MHSANAFILNYFCGIWSVLAFIGKKNRDHALLFEQLLLFYLQVQSQICLSVFLLDIDICCTHLAVAFFQIGLHCIHFICSCIPWVLNPWWPWHCSWHSLLFELQEHYKEIMQHYHYDSLWITTADSSEEVNHSSFTHVMLYSSLF